MQQPKPPLDPPRRPPPRAFPSRPVSQPSKRPIRLSSKPASASNLFPDPSSGLLALLVTVAGSSPVYGRPLESDIPPDFLCPRLHLRSSSQPIPYSDPSSWSWEPCDFPQASGSSQSSSSSANALSDQLPRPRKRRVRGGNDNIADKFEQSSDGRWRKVESWELYGSSSCAVRCHHALSCLSRVTRRLQITQCMDTNPTELPVQNDATSPDPDLTTLPPSMPSLPNGWGKHSGGDSMTGIILALSLSLACTLILFMMGIVLWRKKRRKGDDDDAERTGSVRDPDDEEVSEEVKRARSQQRMWARASARWMANVRQSARRRRKRMSAVAAKGSDSGLLHDRQTAQASSSAVSLTPTAPDSYSSRWTRPRSIRSRSRTRTRSRSTSPASSRSQRDDDGDNTPSASPHPPAYIPDPSPSRPAQRRHSSCAYQHPSHASVSDEPDPAPSISQSRPSSPLPYEPALHAAHVATDDKAVLAQMARLASAPEPSSPDLPDESSELRPSVPVLEVDGFEPLPPELLSSVIADVSEDGTVLWPSSPSAAHDTPSSALDGPSPYSVVPLPSGSIDSEVPSYTEDALRHPPLVLPPPPSKVALTGPMFYEYPNEFEEDVATMEPTLGPSSPPFEEPSAPPFVYDDRPEGAHMILPSAPPLDLADELPSPSERLIPSAPPLDDAPSGSCPSRTSADTSGAEPCAPPSAPDDHGNASSSLGPVSPRQAPRPGETSPPQYLP
ncbi:hypothetical protein C8Q76DRAFT_448100 [Earliella scabrosa]|nr:hypothetical protein C8Q76DRAFT_448100 [Earliella scabrosa]